MYVYMHIYNIIVVVINIKVNSWWTKLLVTTTIVIIKNDRNDNNHNNNNTNTNNDCYNNETNDNNECCQHYCQHYNTLSQTRFSFYFYHRTCYCQLYAIYARAVMEIRITILCHNKKTESSELLLVKYTTNTKLHILNIFYQ